MPYQVPAVPAAQEPWLILLAAARVHLETGRDMLNRAIQLIEHPEKL